MCCVKVLSRIENGMLLFCPSSKVYQLTYKNLFLSLSRIELDAFMDYIQAINVSYWEKEYENSIYEKKIPIPTTQKNLMLMFQSSEIEELKILFGLEDNNKYLSANEINYKTYLN